MAETINVSDEQIFQQITNIGHMIARIDNDLAVITNYGPSGGPGIGEYHKILPGNSAGDFDPTAVPNQFSTLAQTLLTKTQEIRTNLLQRQNELIHAASDMTAAEQAATQAASGW